MYAGAGAQQPQQQQQQQQQIYGAGDYAEYGNEQQQWQGYPEETPQVCLLFLK